MNENLYKYRSLKNFDFFLDIVVNKRLYATTYPQMNDPMEGLYTYEGEFFTEEIRKKIYNEKNALDFCCLSLNKDDTRMWAYYADGHEGVVIETKISSNKYDIVKINYEANLIHFQNDIDLQAKKILSSKHVDWEYENEIRVFKHDKLDKFVNVDVKKIILGRKISNINRNKIRDLINKMDLPIEIEEIPYENYNYLKYKGDNSTL